MEKYLIIFIALIMVPSVFSLSCGDAINTSVTMDKHLTNCAKIGLILLDNATLDCNGFAVRGRGVDQSYGIAIAGKNVMVRNCESYDFTVGLFANNAHDLSIQNYTVLETGQVGLLLSNSAHVNVTGIRLGGIDQGAYIQNSEDVNLSRGRIDSKRVGVKIDSSRAIAIDGLSISTPGIGVDTGLSAGVHLTNLSILNSFAGMTFLNSSTILVQDNRIIAKSAGIQLAQSEKDRIEGNIIGNAEEGISLDSVLHSLLLNNSVNGGIFGLAVKGSDDSLIDGNAVSGSQAANLLIERSERTAVVSNSFLSSPRGIDSFGTGQQAFIGNAIGYHDTGIVVGGNGYSIIRNNFFWANTADLSGDGWGIATRNIFASSNPLFPAGITFFGNIHDLPVGSVLQG